MSALPGTMGKHRKRKQSESPHHPGKRSPSDLIDQQPPSLNPVSSNSDSQPHEPEPPLPKLPLPSQSSLELQHSLSMFPSCDSQPASLITDSPLKSVPNVPQATNHSNHPNFEGFESSYPYGNESDSDSVITAGQRTNAENAEQLEHPVSMQNLVILVEPVEQLDSGDSQATQPDVTQFLSNDLALSKALANSLFGKTGITNMSKNTARNLLVLTMKNTEKVSSLLEIESLGPWKVKCRLPANHTTSIGVIGPFGKGVTNEELTQALTFEGHQGATAERIFKGREHIMTSMFKVTFSGSTLPPYVNIGYQRYEVNTFVGKPWQCFRCQRFGHSALPCKSPPRCVACGGAHGVKDCKHTGTPKCCNCGGAHPANYGGCPKMKQANTVEKTRSVLKLSYRDAVKHVQSENMMNPKSTPSHSNNANINLKTGFPQLQPPSTRSGTWNILDNFNVPHSVPAKPIKCSVGTQTTGPALAVQQPAEPNISLSQLIDLLSRVLSLCHYPDMASAKETVSKLAAETFNNIPSPKTIPHNMSPPCAAATTAPILQECNSLPMKSVGAPHSAQTLETAMDTCTEDVQVNPSPIIGGHYLKKKPASDILRPSPIIGGKSRQAMAGKSLKAPSKALTISSKHNTGKCQ